MGRYDTCISAITSFWFPGYSARLQCKVTVQGYSARLQCKVPVAFSISPMCNFPCLLSCAVVSAVHFVFRHRISAAVLTPSFCQEMYIEEVQVERSCDYEACIGIIMAAIVMYVGL